MAHNFGFMIYDLRLKAGIVLAAMLCLAVRLPAQGVGGGGIVISPGGGSSTGGATNGIQQSNGHGTNTTLVTPTISLNNGSTATTFTFPATSNTNTDQVMYVTGSPFTSGASVGFKMQTTNPIAGNIDANGYYVVDPIAMNVGMIGMQGPNFDTPMMGYMIANSPWPLGILHAHSGYNTYNIMTVGDTTNGDLVEIPYESGVVGTVPHQPLTTGYSIGGTNIYFQAATVSKLFEVNQNNGNVEVYNPASGIFTVLTPINTTFGQVFKANGRLNTANAIDPADVGPANFGNATVQATNFFLKSANSTAAATLSGYFDVSGTEGILMGAANFGEVVYDGSTVMFCMGLNSHTFGDGGIFPTGGNGNGGGNDNTWDIGLTGAPTVTATDNYSTNNHAWLKVAMWRPQSPFDLKIAGQTGAKTINFPSGSIRIAAAGSSVVLTDNLITTNSIVYPVIATHDTTATSCQAVPATGSCTFFLNAAATGEVEIRFLVWNASQ